MKKKYPEEILVSDIQIEGFEPFSLILIVDVIKDRDPNTINLITEAIQEYLEEEYGEVIDFSWEFVKKDWERSHS